MPSTLLYSLNGSYEGSSLEGVVVIKQEMGKWVEWVWSVEEWVWFDIVESVIDLSCYFDIVNTIYT